MKADPIEARRVRIVVVASLTWSLVGFRLELLRAMIDAGHEVIAIAPDDDRGAIATLRAIGVGFQQIPMARTGTNPLADLRTLAALYREMHRLSPDLVLSYTMKPIVYGGLAARLAGVRERYALFTGFGFLFGSSHRGRWVEFVRRVSIALHRRALVGTRTAFAYNEADVADIRRHAMIAPETPLLTIDGSGVDLTHFPSSPPPGGSPVFLLVARLLRDKGIAEYAAAARLIKRDFPDARFQLLGPFDPSPLVIAKRDLDGWIAEGTIEYLGETRDVRPFLAAATVFVLPSYYREGIPRSALEALATGRAIVTADTPGCRETVEKDQNGFLVPPRDAIALAAAMRAFLLDRTLAERMGARSRRLAERRFDVHVINERLMHAMGLARPSQTAFDVAEARDLGIAVPRS